METLLSISIETKDWTEGNHAWFDAKLKPNSIIEISWGDGKKSTMKTYDTTKWCRVAHYYDKSKGEKDSYTITFEGEEPASLEGLIDGTWEMTVEKVNFINCPGLTYLQYTQLPETDFSNAPNISTLIIENYYGSQVDLSCLKGLRKLICRDSERLITLDLTKNDNLEELDFSASYISKIKVSNNSKLKIVANGTYTRIDANSLKWLQMTVDRNGGHIQEEWLDREFSSIGCIGEKS